MPLLPTHVTPHRERLIITADAARVASPLTGRRRRTMLREVVGRRAACCESGGYGGIEQWADQHPSSIHSPASVRAGLPLSGTVVDLQRR